MSEAPTAPAAETLAPAAEAAPAAAAPAATSLVAGATDAGEGTGGEPAGQGAGSEPAAEGGAPAGSEPPKEGEGEAATGAPEQYADFTLPEGVELEGAMLDQVRTFAKAQNFTQEQAQGLVDLGVAQAQQTAQRFADLASESPVVLSQAWAQRWSEQTASDSELGGEKLQATMALNQRVFATFGSPELAQFLSNTGLAHHPEIHRFMAKVGAAVSEDTLVVPSGGQSARNTQGDPIQRAASKMYPNMA